MTTSTSQNQPHLYRVDKFRVPPAARAEFLARVRSTHELLRTLPGFMQDSVLEQTGGPGTFNFVTIAVWGSAEALDAAREVVTAKHNEIGFDPGEMLARLGIEADVANYARVTA